MWDTWKGPGGWEAVRQGAGAGASLDAALHHAVLAASPAGACLVTLKDQGGFDLVKLLKQPPVLGCGGRGTVVSLWGPSQLPGTQRTPQETPL